MHVECHATVFCLKSNLSWLGKISSVSRGALVRGDEKNARENNTHNHKTTPENKRHKI